MAGVAAPLSPPKPAPAAPRETTRMSGSDRFVEAVERNWFWALAGLMLLDAVLLLYLGRGLTFLADDWSFVIYDFGGGIHSLLAAHNGHIVFFPVAIYKVLFHLVGISHYVVYRLIIIALHLINAGLVFVLASRRVARLPALLATALILFLGAAWEDLLWAFQMGYLLSVAGALGAWVLLERRARWSDVAAMLCLIVAAGSSSLGIPVMVGVAVELAWRRDWRRAWVVAVPAGLYVLWYLGYGENEITGNELINAPGFAADLAAAAFGGLIGRSLEWGRPLALLGTIVLLAWLIRRHPIPARLAGLLATGLSLWIALAVTRSTVSPPETSRYIYLGAVVIVLVGVELLRDVWITPRAAVIATALVAFFAVTGLTPLHAGASAWRATSKTVAAELAALEIAAAHVSPNYQPDTVRAPTIIAAPYLHTVDTMHSSPADAPAQIIASEPAVRTEVDENLVKLEGAGALAPASAATPPSPRLPLVAGASGGPPVRRGNCWRTAAVGVVTYTEFLLPPAGLLIHAGGAPVQVIVRRFSPPLGGVSLGVVAPRETATVRFPVDASGRPWFGRLLSTEPIEVCGVA
jgi:hypothetical protein